MKSVIKYKNTLELNYFFELKAKPELIIDFIYNHVYELINEIKYIPHGDKLNLAESLIHAYSNYYENVIEPSEELWLKTLFPNTTPSYYYNFSFRRFYIGLVGRIFFGACYDYNYWYGEPDNWLINHYFYFVPGSPLTRSTGSTLMRSSCQFILLDNYSTFQVIDARNPYSYMYYNYIIFKSANNYSGQRYNAEEAYAENIRYEQALSYSPGSCINLIEDYKKKFEANYNKKIGDLWYKILDEYEEEKQFDPITYKAQNFIQRRLEEEFLKVEETNEK